MQLFGKEPRVWVPWVVGGVALVLLLLWLRSRNQGGAGAISAPGPDMSFGSGASGPSAPASYSGESGTDPYTSQLNQLRVQEAQQGLANVQKMFDLQFGQAATLGSLYTQEAQQSFAQLSGARSRTKVECGKGESMYTDVNGNLACKPSGSKGLKSITNTIGSGLQGIVGGFFQGAATVAPAAGQYYAGQALGLPRFGTPGIHAAKPKQPGVSYPSVSLV